VDEKTEEGVEKESEHWDAALGEVIGGSGWRKTIQKPERAKKVKS